MSVLIQTSRARTIPTSNLNDGHPKDELLHYICLTSLPFPSGRSASHSSRSTEYSVSVNKISNARFHTSVMA